MLEEMGRGVARYLKETPREPSHYGAAMTQALFHRLGEKVDIDINECDSHNEFVAYALTEMGDQTRLKLHRHHPTTNWTLLKYLVQIRWGNRKKIEDALLLLRSRQESGGFIYDEPGVRSLQYCAFSLAIVAQMFEETGNRELQDCLKRGVESLLPYILSNGDAMYLGRGMQQSFGYGALIYLLAVSHQREALDRVVSFVNRFQRKDGSYPLIMRCEEPETKAGWYPYNRKYDYLPLFALFCLKAAEALESKPLVTPPSSLHPRIQTDHYEAILIPRSGPWYSDVPLPYIVAKGESIIPCLGGELEDYPYSYFPRWKRSLRSRSISQQTQRGQVLISPLGVMRCHYFFKEREVVLSYRTRTPFVMHYPFCFLPSTRQVDQYRLEGENYKVHCNYPLERSGEGYGASGVLPRYLVKNKECELRFQFD